MWEDAYAGPCPTKLPAGRVEIVLPPPQKVTAFELHYDTAEGVAKLADGRAVRVFFDATGQTALMRIPGPPPKNIEVLSPLEVSKRVRGGSAGPDSHSVNALSYREAQTGSEGSERWYVQTAADGLQYCGCLETQRVGDATLVAVTVTTTRDAPICWHWRAGVVRRRWPRATRRRCKPMRPGGERSGTSRSFMCRTRRSRAITCLPAICTARVAARCAADALARRLVGQQRQPAALARRLSQ